MLFLTFEPWLCIVYFIVILPIHSELKDCNLMVYKAEKTFETFVFDQ